MKRISFLFIIMWFSVIVFADGPDFKDGILNYKLINGECYVYGLVNGDGPQRLVIPSTAKCQGRTFSVVGIVGWNWINQCKFHGVKELILPETLVSIGDYAFSMSSLESIKMDGVEIIGTAAFDGSRDLKSISGKNIKFIGVNAFEGCENLKKIVISPSCMEIRENAFLGCKNPDLVIIIEDSDKPLKCYSDFATCKGKKIYIGRDMYHVSWDPYYFKNVDFGDQVTYMQPIELHKSRRADYKYDQYQNITIGASITEVPNFYNDDNDVKSIRLVSSTPPVVKGEFSNRTYLYCKLYVPKGSLTAYKNAPIWKEFFNIEEYESERTRLIAQKAAQEATEAEERRIAQEKADREARTKRGNLGSNLKWELYEGTLTISGKGEMINMDSREAVPWKQYKKSIKSVIISEDITSVGDNAFYKCWNLISVTIPNSVISIGEYAFYDCSGLSSITIPNSVTSIGKSAFENCRGLSSITIPNSVTSIGKSAFEKCRGLSSITIPNSVTSIGESAFQDCKSLKTVELPNSATSIGGSAFRDCSGLTSVTIPNSVTSIGKSAFEKCSGLISVTIPNSVTSIGNSAFYGILNIVYNGTASGSPWGAKSVNGFIDGYFVFNDNTKTTLLACSKKASGKIEIPNSVTSIGDYAFYACSGLTSLTIPNSVTSIGDGAFEGCTGLTSVTIPNSVTSIGRRAFMNCHKLPVVDNVRYADTYLVDVVDKSLSTYTIKNGTRWIGDRAFYCCRSMTSMTLPNSVTSIGDCAFGECSSLTSVTIPNSVTCIGDEAFYQCHSTITIPKSVTNIGRRAFDFCDHIKIPKKFKGNLDLSKCKKVKYY